MSRKNRNRNRKPKAVEAQASGPETPAPAPAPEAPPAKKKKRSTGRAADLPGLDGDAKPAPPEAPASGVKKRKAKARTAGQIADAEGAAAAQAAVATAAATTAGAQPGAGQPETLPAPPDEGQAPPDGPAPADPPAASPEPAEGLALRPDWVEYAKGSERASDPAEDALIREVASAPPRDPPKVLRVVSEEVGPEPVVRDGETPMQATSRIAVERLTNLGPAAEFYPKLTDEQIRRANEEGAVFGAAMAASQEFGPYFYKAKGAMMAGWHAERPTALELTFGADAGDKVPAGYTEPSGPARPLPRVNGRRKPVGTLSVSDALGALEAASDLKQAVVEAFDLPVSEALPRLRRAVEDADGAGI